MQKKEYSIDIAGKPLTVQFTDLADQAHGSVIVRYGNTVVLVTAVMSNTKREGIDFFPLVVDYEEKFYASGQILGSRFVRREGRPSDEAVLSGRIVDRTIRPLFGQHLRNEVQVVVTVLSIDEYDPDILAVLGASLALGTSNIPWNGPVSAVRIGRTNGELVTNPTYAIRGKEAYDFDLIACGKDGNINMIEIGGKEIPNTDIVKALTKASEEIHALQAFQQSIIKEIGKPKRVIEAPAMPEAVAPLFRDTVATRLADHVFSGPGHDGINALKEEWKIIVKEALPDAVSLAMEFFEEKVNEILHKEAIDNNRRPDGRGMDDVRPIYVQAGGISPILHGSGIFYRGGTHVLSALTLGGPGDAQIIDGMEAQEEKRFMHHYNFPPFSTGETGRVGGMNRRMIGHGALAEKALEPIIPSKEQFPYTIRLVSEALASNGSTSMGSVCGSTLALMDGGVPIKAPVAGIASGLMMENSTRYKVLTDIQGPEDHHGDMDFKVAGTRNGVTAVQMDVKVEGVSIKILAEALEKAAAARYKILDYIEKEIAAPRSDISPKAPKILTVKIKIDQIGMVIGPGGKTVKKVREETGAEIDIEDDGTVFLTGANGSAEAAKKIIEDMTREFKAGDRFEGEVVKIAEFGAFVHLVGNTDGLVHVSEIAQFRVDKVETYLKVGDKVPVVVKEVDDRGRLSLSIKRADPNFIKEKPQAKQ